MGYRELIESLRREAERKINQLWSECHTEAEKIRTESYRKVEQMREEYRSRQAQSMKECEETLLSEAENRARRIHLSAEKALSDRLFQVALSLLHGLRNEHYKDVFTSLVHELPDKGWDKVRVNPEDVGIAQGNFPGSDIIADATINGGFEASKGNGKVHVVNTFEKRLERGWEDIRPLIIGDIYREMRKYGIPSEA